ncbi:ATPase [Lacrimispora sp. JR3]|uniref:ATPase n=1 Tax=Lacrimispora sinapis TaxID=3111456 RepID=UPI003749CC5D
MDKVIEKISDIESAATSIMDNANERKKAFAKEMEERTAAFDHDLEVQTNKKIEALRKEMEIKMNHQLEKQKNDSMRVLAALEAHYEKEHHRYVENLFQTMIKE